MFVRTARTKRLEVLAPSNAKRFLGAQASLPAMSAVRREKKCPQVLLQ
jgi:hypothetical protein